MKRIIIVCIALIGSYFLISPALASQGTTPEVCYDTVVDVPAHDQEVLISEGYIQRYSWTGGPHEEDSPPAFPSSDWQPNVKGDPHGIGHEGAYYRSNGNSGKGDWFYLEYVDAVYDTVWVEDTFKEIVVPCPEEPTTDIPTTDTPVDPPVTDTDPPKEDTPTVDKPKEDTPTVTPEASLPNTGA